MDSAFAQQILAFLRRYGLPVLWALSLPLLLWGGTLSASQETGYPIGSVLLFAGVTLLETAVLYLILRPHSFYHSWGRFFIALFFYIPLSMTANLFRDVPGTFYGHALWLQLVVRLLGIGLVISLVLAVRDWRRRRREREQE